MQIFIFLTSCLCGILSGVVYDVFYIARYIVCGFDKGAYTVKDKIFTAVCDVLYFIIFAAMFIFTSVLFGFYRLRLYMLVGAAFGAILYLKSLHIFLAYFVKRVYNSYKVKRVKNNKTQ
jgi:hypothetical protein